MRVAIIIEVVRGYMTIAFVVSQRQAHAAAVRSISLAPAPPAVPQTALVDIDGVNVSIHLTSVGDQVCCTIDQGPS